MRMSNGQPPPQELTWDSTLRELLDNTFTFSPELTDAATPPRFIRMYGDHWQVNYQLSGLPDPQAQSVVDIRVSARPVAPSTILIKI
jgi:hypothetical protein